MPVTANSDRPERYFAMIAQEWSRLYVNIAALDEVYIPNEWSAICQTCHVYSQSLYSFLQGTPAGYKIIIFIDLNTRVG